METPISHNSKGCHKVDQTTPVRRRRPGDPRGPSARARRKQDPRPPTRRGFAARAAGCLGNAVRLREAMNQVPEIFTKKQLLDVPAASGQDVSAARAVPTSAAGGRRPCCPRRARGARRGSEAGPGRRRSPLPSSPMSRRPCPRASGLKEVLLCLPTKTKLSRGIRQTGSIDSGSLRGYFWKCHLSTANGLVAK